MLMKAKFMTRVPAGWLARICYPLPVRLRQQFFSVKRYGGWEDAFSAAQAFVNTTLTQFPRGPLHMKSGPRKSSVTGVRGVSPSSHRAKSGKVYPCYVSLFKRDGKWAGKYFYPGKHGGMKGALEAAIAFRRKFEASLPSAI